MKHLNRYRSMNETIAPSDALVKQTLARMTPRKRPRRRTGRAVAIAAACLALIVLGFRALSPTDPLITKEPPRAVLRLAGADVGEFHLLQLDGSDGQAQAEFVLYVNEELYRAYEQAGVYIIEPLAALPEGFPVCRMEITRLPGLTPTQAVQTVVNELRDAYQNVTEPATAAPFDGLVIHADDGNAWDAAQRDVYLADDRQGGIYRIDARYFTEATEGHGARFADMAGTFEVTTDAQAPDWFTALRQTADGLIPALFAGRTEDAADFASDAAQLDDYGYDVSDDVSVATVDYTVDDDRAPSHAVISVRHRLGTEDSYQYLTIELSYRDGRWLADWSGIEK